MNVDNIVKILDAITKLLNVLLWPIIFLFILIKFGPALGEFITNLGELSFKGLGIEGSMKRKQADAAAALAAAAVSRPETGVTPETAANVAKEATQSIMRRAERSTVLWVDDNPENNIYERRALEALGLTIVLATSTEEALKKHRQQRFDLIISDMGRPPDSQAGYTFLEKLRSSKDQTPFIIYASSRAPEHIAESQRRGAIGCTNRPDELFEMVLLALRRG